MAMSPANPISAQQVEKNAVPTIAVAAAAEKIVASRSIRDPAILVVAGSAHSWSPCS